MGTWGVKLNQNDVYADLKDIYTALLRYGKSDEEALEITVKYFSGLKNGENEDSIIFRLSLADILHRLGRLTDEIRNNALRTIADGADLDEWYKYSQVKGDARKAVLDELKEMLTSEQPKAKKFSKKRYKICSWKNGDIFRYKFNSDIAEEYGMQGKYLFMQKTDDYFSPDPDLRILKKVLDTEFEKRGDIYPIIHIWISDDADFLPDYDNRNEAIPNLGTKGKHDPMDHRFYILDLPNKNDCFEFITNKDIIIPDNEDTDLIKANGIRPKHLTWKFFDKHVIGRYLWWEKDIDIFGHRK
ncbi:MAG: hypothetical protein J6I46_11540 [Ruminococcus sp.]|nr:hypothetical protein [Ruminococcus sp.]